MAVSGGCKDILWRFSANVLSVQRVFGDLQENSCGAAEDSETICRLHRHNRII
ncbi:hypothetical protein BABINDRAFT_163659 [Babjeviella inositovora NRRL Y-12698]|uniref:Uncharacterized protein n=1 Tax=Babjeviella inositovora NRRL Y-12698 TaxID=984486 RepID=A0A1E3QI86_9ASCO|nr:uncharacterized protein BABINDRAFT_163659 [Babjeviella inositovora NRRL Y-12698]ODQ77415.1 hypothetical protein BABINDRAFT_163659 [Babjeviella inositovora NRRL Y-12698]